MDFTLKQLEIFVAVINQGSTLAAARHLGISQPAVSSALTELEGRLGTTLFHRWKKRIIVNENGRSLQPLAQLLLANARDIDQQFLNSGRQFRGTLRIGASSTPASYILPALLPDFLVQHPGVKAHIRSRNRETIIAQVEGFSLDIGIIAGQCDNPALISSRWLTDELCVFCTAGHPLSFAPHPSPSDLTASPWVTREKGSTTREVFFSAVPEAMRTLMVAMELDNLEAIKRAVEHSDMLGCVSRFAIHREVAAGRLRILPTPFLKLERTYFLIAHRQRQNSPLIRLFIEHCQQEGPGKLLPEA